MFRLLGFVFLAGTAIYHFAARSMVLLFLILCFMLIAFYGGEE